MVVRTLLIISEGCFKLVLKQPFCMEKYSRQLEIAGAEGVTGCKKIVILYTKNAAEPVCYVCNKDCIKSCTKTRIASITILCNIQYHFLCKLFCSQINQPWKYR